MRINGFDSISFFDHFQTLFSQTAIDLMIMEMSKSIMVHSDIKRVGQQKMIIIWIMSQGKRGV